MPMPFCTNKQTNKQTNKRTNEQTNKRNKDCVCLNMRQDLHGAKIEKKKRGTAYIIQSLKKQEMKFTWKSHFSFEHAQPSPHLVSPCQWELNKQLTHGNSTRTSSRFQRTGVAGCFSSIHHLMISTVKNLTKTFVDIPSLSTMSITGSGSFPGRGTVQWYFLKSILADRSFWAWMPVFPSAFEALRWKGGRGKNK